MIETRPLADGLSVCSFVSPAELHRVAQHFRTIINARPDGEEPGQPSSAEIAEAARQLGLEYVHVPVIPGRIGDDQAAAFAQALRDKPGPVLAFCKSGARAASLWALARASEHDSDTILEAAARAGFDLQGLKPRLDACAAG